MSIEGKDPMKYSQWNPEIDNQRSEKIYGPPIRGRVKSLRLSDVRREVEQEMALEAAARKEKEEGARAPVAAAAGNASGAGHERRLSVTQFEQINNLSCMKTYSANMWMANALNKPKQEDLFMGLWHSKEIACLFSDSNTGKSVLAVQIAEHLARQGRVVAYYDAEMSEEQFLSRYRDDATGEVYKFAQSLYITRPSGNETTPEGEGLADTIIKRLRKMMSMTEATDLVIDNITALCDANYKAEEAAKLMRNLKEMRDVCGWNILVVAHTPKRDMGQVITQNDLGGSKVLFNFFDAVFALGMSRLEPGVRYLKQLKSRIGSIKYDENHVLTATIGKENGMLKLIWGKEAQERQHLAEPLVIDEDVKATAVEMLQNQASIRNVAEATGLTKSSIGRLRVQLKKRGML